MTVVVLVDKILNLPNIPKRKNTEILSDISSLSRAMVLVIVLRTPSTPKITTTNKSRTEKEENCDRQQIANEI